MAARTPLLAAIAGLFVLLTAAPADAAKPLFVVTDSPYEMWQGSRTKVHVVAFGPGFRPAAGAKVFAGNREVGTLDAHGTLVFSHRPRGRFQLRVETDIDGEAYLGSVSMETYRRTSSFESANLFVYTDRGVYRPGEEVLVRALNWRLRGEFRPIHKADIEVTLSGPRSRIVTGGQMTTDAFGVAATRLSVPEDAPEGNYTLTVRYRGAEETARIRVKRFRPPAIRVEHNLPRYIAPVTPDLAVEVKLGYFTGGAPAAGKLDVRAVHAGKELFSLSQPIEAGKPHRFSLPLDPIRKVVPDRARFQVKLKATDNFGRADEVIRDILYAKRPYVAVPDLDKDVYAGGEEVVLSVRLTDPDGVPVRGKPLTLEGDGGKIKLEATSDEGGVAVFKFPMPPRNIQVTVRAPDVPDPLFSRHIGFIHQKPMLASLPKPVVQEKRFMPITVTFDPAFIPVERVVHVDVTDYSGAVVGGFKIPIRRIKGKYVARGRFRAPSWGSMLLTMFAVGIDREDRRSWRRARTVGLLTEGLSLTSHPDKELTVTLDGLPDEAPPRSKLNVAFRVRAPGGKARTASLGVMLVDRAVLTLLDPLEKTPMDRFYNPTLKVLSTTGSDILTWPVVSRNWGYDRYDIALPPFGFLEGGPLERPRRHRGKMKAAGSAKPMVMPKAPAKKAKPMTKTEDERESPMAEMSRARDDSGRTARPRPANRKKPAPKIIIRTDLPETAVWEPQLVAKGGRASLAVRLPEALTEQELIVVASDKVGGVGLTRKTVRVTQPLFVRSDLPRTMVSGDKLSVNVFVQNTTKEAVEADVRLLAKGLESSPAARKVKIAARGSAAATFTLVAGKPGAYPYVVEATAGKHADAEKRTLDVRPRGPGIPDELHAVLTAKDAWGTTIERAGDEYLEAHLEIGFPSVFPALQEIENLLGRSVWWADSFLATPLTAAQLERYLTRHLPRHPRRKEIRAYLVRVARALPSRQNPDGGFGWWRTGPGSNPHATAHALRLMAALRDADIAVDRAVIQRAAGLLQKNRVQDGLWSVDAIAFWEGSTDKVRLQAGAFVFRSLAEAARVERKLDRGWIEELGGRFAKYLDDGPDDVLTAAEAALGLMALERASKRKLRGKARERLVRAARSLIDMRKLAHWEPSWFHAYGGTIEATVASLELLAGLDRRAFADEIRGGLMHLLSTRGEWGMWHCPFGTAEAIRAFTFLPPPRREIPSSVRVSLGGKEIARVKISPRDPFLSAIRLRHLALGSKLVAGKNELRVRYDGRLEAPLRLVVRRWPDKPTPVVSAGDVSLQRALASSSIRLGEPVEVTLALAASKHKGELRILAPVPANASLDEKSLETLRKSPGVVGARLGDEGIQILVAGGAERKLSYRLEGQRPGSALMAPATVSSTLRQGVAATTETMRLTVRQ